MSGTLKGPSPEASRKGTKHTEEQISFALKQLETGVSIGKICRKIRIAESTFFNWKKKYVGLGVSELRRLKQLEEEHRKLKGNLAPAAFAERSDPVHRPPCDSNLTRTSPWERLRGTLLLQLEWIA